jgi:hypothetical protein
VNRSLNLMARRRDTLRPVELIHMRIRHTQIRHVLPPFVFLSMSRGTIRQTFI